MDKKITDLVKELATQRNTEQAQKEKERSAEGDRQRLEKLTWFQPVLDVVGTLALDDSINNRMWIFTRNYAGDPYINARIAARCRYSKERRKFVLSANGQKGIVTVEIYENGYSHDKLLETRYMPVADACALLIDRAADMIRGG